MKKLICVSLLFTACEVQNWHWKCENKDQPKISEFIIKCVENARSGIISPNHDQDSDNLVETCGQEARRVYCAWHNFKIDEDIK